MSFLSRTLKSRLSNLKSLLSIEKFPAFSSSTKISTGLTGLQADPAARSNLLNLYGALRDKLRCEDIPEDYVYKKGMLELLDYRSKLIKNESFSDLDLETELGEGQLEELVEQAQEELELVNKIVNEWKPWGKK